MLKLVYKKKIKNNKTNEPTFEAFPKYITATSTNELKSLHILNPYQLESLETRRNNAAYIRRYVCCGNNLSRSLRYLFSVSVSTNTKTDGFVLF